MSDIYVEEFISTNWNSKRNKKYMIILFRLAPFLFHGKDLSTSILKDIEVPFGMTDNSFEYVFNNYFHQPHLTYADYEVCDACGIYLCPIHLKLNPMNFEKCSFCNKSWCVCIHCVHANVEKDLCERVHFESLADVENGDNKIFDLILK
jgi:hypothetical protein